jgi:hypothetical protein
MLQRGTAPGTLAGRAVGVLASPYPLTTGVSASHARTALHQVLTSLHAVSYLERCLCYWYSPFLQALQLPCRFQHTPILHSTASIVPHQHVLAPSGLLASDHHLETLEAAMPAQTKPSGRAATCWG